MPEKQADPPVLQGFENLARVLLYPLYNKNKNTQHPNKNNTYRL